LYVYLHKDTDLLLKNINLRGRSYESHITRDYLDRITEGYLNYFAQENDIPILNIDTNQIDFTKNPEDFDKIDKAIFNKQYHRGITTVILE
jgi:deoxyadenosine/deoxycytidine kinase